MALIIPKWVYWLTGTILWILLSLFLREVFWQSAQFATWPKIEFSWWHIAAAFAVIASILIALALKKNWETVSLWPWKKTFKIMLILSLIFALYHNQKMIAKEISTAYNLIVPPSQKPKTESTTTLSPKQKSWHLVQTYPKGFNPGLPNAAGATYAVTITVYNKDVLHFLVHYEDYGRWHIAECSGERDRSVHFVRYRGTYLQGKIGMPGYDCGTWYFDKIDNLRFAGRGKDKNGREWNQELVFR